MFTCEGEKYIEKKKEKREKREKREEREEWALAQ